MTDQTTAPAEQLVGTIQSGTVTGVKEFGAFVQLDTDDGGPAVSGMVHVSEIAPTFVENIYAHVGEGDEVDVAVMDVRDDGRVALSMVRADPDFAEEGVPDLRPKDDKDFRRRLRRHLHKAQQKNGEYRRNRRRRLGLRGRRRR